MGGNIDSSNYALNINMIGESMYFLYLYLTKNIYTKTKSKDIKDKKSIIDFWDFDYKLNSPIETQLENVFKIYENNKSNAEINSKEALIVHIKNKNSELINKIFSRLEKIKMPHYFPLILFLLDEYCDSENENIIIPNKELYPNLKNCIIYTAEFIDKSQYLFESKQKQLTEQGEYKMEKILNILLRFCSYHNDLGDRFSIGEDDKKINYDLTEKYFPFTINICCIGRFGKGKSTCVNCLLGEIKAKESKSGASTTKKINYYQISNQPIKIYDIPGFENKETISNAVYKIKELNDEINELKEQLHIILYIIKSTDERMFADIEFEIINEISKQKDSKLLYILTHSSKDTDIEEKIDMINVGLKNVLINNKVDNLFNIYSKMKADKNNCIFVNFHPYENMPIYGIDEFFKKLSFLAKETDIYKKYIKKNKKDNEFQNLINEEADIRKMKAEKILLYNSIGAGAIGIIPGLDLAIQKFVIQKSAMKKIGQIFGLDINLISREKENEKENSFKNANNDNNFTIEDDKDNNKESNKYSNKDSNKDSNKNYSQFFSKFAQFSTSALGGIASFSEEIINYINQVAQISGEITLTALRGITITFLFIGSGIGIGTGFYFTYKHCKELIEKLYKYFKENMHILSNDLEQAVQYLEFRAKFHKKK